MTTTKPLRWTIARLLDKLPRQCWADLVCWALRMGPTPARSPWSPIGTTCRRDAEETGCCYCGKIRALSAPADRRAA